MKKRVCITLLYFAIATVFVAPSLPCFIARTAFAADDDASRAIIVLSAPFSIDGMATEITRNYGSLILVPDATAKVGNTEVLVSTSVSYLGAAGWVSYDLPASRQMVIGDVPAPDRNRVAMYNVLYSAGEGAQKSELTYTIWVGLEMFLTTSDELTSFVGDTLVLPECRPMYRFRDAGGTTQYIDISATRKISFYPVGSSVAEIVTTSENAITFDKAGVYELTFASPQTIASDGITYVSGNVERVARISVYAKRSDPIGDADGMYRCAYTIGGQSATGLAMAQASCASTVDIEKRNGSYLLYFTLTAAQYMEDLFMEQSGCAVAALVLTENYVGVNLHATTVFVLDGYQLKDELFMRVKIIPMSTVVSFSVKVDLENAYFTGASNVSAQQALPLIQADEPVGGAVQSVGSRITIPPAEVSFDGVYALSYSVSYVGTGAKREGISVADRQFTAQKAGDYTVKYFALIVEDGTPYVATLEQSLTIKAAGNWKTLAIIVVVLAVAGAAAAVIILRKRGKK
ncbi:MAG: hypothetical protein FWD30_02120 [Dehalococcoidia bacterium]|nr:hypothetical protein [Dehalococcoidia bacterium]